MKKLFKQKELCLLYFSQVCNQSVYWGLFFLLPDVLFSKGYSEWISFGGGTLFYILGAATMMIPSGYFADKFSAKWIIIISCIPGIILYYLFLLSPLLSDPAVLALLFFLGSSIGLVNPVGVAHGTKLVPERPGLISAFLMGLVWCLAESIGPGGGGMLTTLFTENAPTKALCVLGILFVFCIILTSYLPNGEPKSIDLESA